MKEANNEAVIAAIRETSNFGDLIGHYVSMRDQVDAIKKEMAEKIDPLQTQMKTIENRILELMLDSGQQSAKSEYGTAYMKASSSCKVADWNVLFDWIQKNDAYHMLVHNVGKEAVTAYIDESGEVPPGLNLATFNTIQVRRAG